MWPQDPSVDFIPLQRACYVSYFGSRRSDFDLHPVLKLPFHLFAPLEDNTLPQSCLFSLNPLHPENPQQLARSSVSTELRLSSTASLLQKPCLTLSGSFLRKNLHLEFPRQGPLSPLPLSLLPLLPVSRIILNALHPRSENSGPQVRWICGGVLL